MSDLSDLMAKDPLLLTRSDRAPIIEYYRSMRAQFMAGGAPKAAKATKAPKAKINLDDLDLGGGGAAKINLGDLDL